MSTQTPVPYRVWKDGVEKWEEGCRCAEFPRARTWWLLNGSSLCSFCCYYQTPGGASCGDCPLFDHTEAGICAVEWERIRAAFRDFRALAEQDDPSDEERRRVIEETFAVFQENARALLARIRALPHTEPEEA